MDSNRLKSNISSKNDNEETSGFEENNINNFISFGKKYRFIHINPGFISDFGHHLTQNQKLKKLITSDGGDFIVLGHKKIDKRLIKDLHAIPTFTYSTWVFTKCDSINKYCTSFYYELLHAAELINIIDPETRNIFFMYLADSKHVSIIIDIAKSINQDRNFFIINLFHNHNEFFSKKGQFGILSYEFYLALTTTAKIRRRYNISLSVETDILQKEILDYVNEHFPIMPLFTSKLDEYGEIKNLETTIRDKKVLTVYLPSMSPDRGYELVCDLILLAKENKTFSLFKFVLRNQNVNNDNIKKVLEKVSASSEIIEGILPEEKYVQLMLDADIILIPYKKEDFYARTSGVYSDAVLAGKPVIATRQTWVGQQIIKYNNGVTFEGENVQDFHDALIKLHNNFLKCSRNSIKARKEWLKNNNEKAFLRFVKNNSINKVNPVDDTSREDKWQLINLQRVIQYKNGVINEITREKDEMIKKRDEMIKNRDDGIKKLKAVLNRKDEMIKSRDEEIKNLEEGLIRKEEMIKDRDNQLRQKVDALKEKEEMIRNREELTKKKDEMIKDLDEGLKNLKEELKKKEEMIKYRDEAIKDLKPGLNRKDEKIKHILESKTYRVGRLIVSPLRQLKRMLTNKEKQK